MTNAGTTAAQENTAAYSLVPMALVHSPMYDDRDDRSFTSFRSTPGYATNYQYLDVPRRGWQLLSPFRNSRKREAMRYFDDMIRHLEHQVTKLREESGHRVAMRLQGATVDGLTQDLGERDAALTEMQEHWNFLSFKHQLLIDMWALRVLDNEELANHQDAAATLH